MKEKPSVGYPFLGRFLRIASLWRRRMSVYISLFTVGIPVKYSNEFRELFDATTYILWIEEI